MSTNVAHLPVRSSKKGHLNVAGLDPTQREVVCAGLAIYAAMPLANYRQYLEAVTHAIEVLRERGDLTDEVETQLRARCETAWSSCRPAVRP